jgi:hypothetical protein
VLTTCEPSTVWCSRERLPAAAAQPAKACQSCSASDYYYYMRSRVAQSVWCLATDWTAGRSRFDPRQRQEIFPLNLYVQTGSGAHPDSCTMGTGVHFPGGKARPGRDADHSPLSSADVVIEQELYISPCACIGVLWDCSTYMLYLLCCVCNWPFSCKCST